MEQILVNGSAVDYSELPEHMQGAMRRYVENGIEPGGFLTAVLCNDLMRAIGRADSINKGRIHDYVTWLYNSAPPSCFGSEEKVTAWIAKRTRQAA